MWRSNQDAANLHCGFIHRRRDHLLYKIATSKLDAQLLNVRDEAMLSRSIPNGLGAIFYSSTMMQAPYLQQGTTPRAKQILSLMYGHGVSAHTSAAI